MTKPRYKWQPLRPASRGKSSDELIRHTMAQYNEDREAAIARLDAYEDQCEVWINDTYQVQTRDCGDNLIHINIRRRDGGPILRDWRHFQQIKNELVGPECEAIELYPAESRLVDTSNKYHLWAIKDPTFRFPIGMEDRDVCYESGGAPGLRQRPL